jgi:3-deoxy-manno-octulosonate cytidylyltransferase (CMP-KDO synthetase)
MRTIIVIPARYASSRLPGKPLLRATGKYLIEHVYERAARARSAQKILVATDDKRIESAVRSFGGNVVLTRADHASGTDRIAEAVAHEFADVVINLQGDEPLIEPDALDFVGQLLVRHQQAAMATLATPLKSLAQYHNPNCVKVVVGELGQALYFSRSSIPHVRDSSPRFGSEPFQFFQHIGLYAYRREFLLRLAQTPSSALEQLEKLEQLRVLALGQRIQVGVVAHAAAGVDTPEDYDQFVKQWSAAHPPVAIRQAA